jgi:urease accessory protein
MTMDVYEKLDEALTKEAGAQPDEVIALDHLIRDKGRFRINAASGKEVRVFLERGNTLKAGQVLKSQCGKIIQVSYAPEPIMRATAKNWPDFVRACYHLGNRHVRVEIAELYLQITPDHVLAELLVSLGLDVEEMDAVFIPEPGAYTKGGAQHQHSHHDH